MSATSEKLLEWKLRRGKNYIILTNISILIGECIRREQCARDKRHPVGCGNDAGTDKLRIRFKTWAHTFGQLQFGWHFLGVMKAECRHLHFGGRRPSNAAIFHRSNCVGLLMLARNIVQILQLQ